MGWPVEDTEVVSVVGRPLSLVRPAVQPGRRLLVLLDSGRTAGALADWLVSAGYGPSRLTLLSDLGSDAEAAHSGTASTWTPVGDTSLAMLAVEPVPDTGAEIRPRTPGLPDEAYDSDGQLTKHEVRAITLAALGPAPGGLLWDVGAGSGSVGIEWMRVHPSRRAIAVEPRPDRLERIAANAEALGVPGLRIVAGRAPDALAGLPRPDAVFIGGAVSLPGVIEACLAALPDGGRLVANGVTLETETVLAGWYSGLGGSLIRIAVQRAGAVGSFTGWRPAMPVTQWAITKQTGDGQP
jgi:precorrin-6Y C5,15-methyltransferase (decarboxylating)